MSEAFEKWKAAGMSGSWLMMSDADAKVIWDAAYTAGMERAADILKSFDDMPRMGGIVTADMIAAAIRKEMGK